MIEIETGKVLVVVLQTIGEVDDEGHVKVFFELNGEPRVIGSPTGPSPRKIQTRRKADEGDEAHLAAPFPGVI